MTERAHINDDASKLIFVCALLIAKPSNTFDKVFDINLEMGCTNSHVVESSIIAFPFESIEKTVIPLTVEQKRIVRETWRIVEPNKKEIGVNVYVR